MEDKNHGKCRKLCSFSQNDTLTFPPTLDNPITN